MLSLNEIKARAYTFVQEWKDESSEDAEAKSFWDGFFNVFGRSRRRMAEFERPVKKLDERQGYIDLLWKGTLLVEHKSRGRDLSKAYTQAKDYFVGLKDFELPRYVLVSDFARFRLYDLDDGSETEFALTDLPDRIDLFGFISGYQKRSFGDTAPVNQEAAGLMAALHDAIADDGFGGHQLEVFLMRILFCLFAEDTGIFEKDQFREFLETRTAEDGSDTGIRLGQLFRVLDTPKEKRQKNLDATLSAFEYINGRMYEEVLDLPEFTAPQRASLIRCTYFDWSQISPAIFGSLFQSVTDPKKRRTLGAHYTSEKNILKVVSGLFLDELRAELDKARGHRTRLEALHNRIAAIKFLDPSCGCGNFLVITYRELRRLEMDIFVEKQKISGQLETGSRIDVSCAYGIEIEEFPARVAETAMWLMDHLMNRELSARFGNLYIRIPLKASAHIAHANALRIDWNEVLPVSECSYVLGNPPFVGAKVMAGSQREDMASVMSFVKNYGLLDYVSAWYYKASKYMNLAPTTVKTAFVSTNSITQGEQTATLWHELKVVQKQQIFFGHQTFKWSNEATRNAAVDCVIIGFSPVDIKPKFIAEYHDEMPVLREVSNINGYLKPDQDIYLYNRSYPINGAKSIGIGNKPIDGGAYLFSDEEMRDFISNEPAAAPWFREWIGAEEFINGTRRWCLWLGECPPQILSKMPLALARVDQVRKSRLASKSAPTRDLASKPTRFHVEFIPDHEYLVIPEVSSEKRNYIPIGYIQPKVLSSNRLRLIPNASKFDFGVLTSSLHMDWMRYVCGRLESRYVYSIGIVYNNFPWPQAVSDKQRQQVEDAAQAVLDARAAHPGATLAQLYDPLTMPANLVQAHRKLDALVDKLYNLPAQATESQRIARLFELYQQLTAPLLPVEKPKGRKKKA